MVNNIIDLKGTPSSGDVENVVDSFSPASGETITTVAYYTSAQTSTAYSLILEEQTLIDRLGGDEAPTKSEPHQLDLQLEEGDELKFAVTENGNTSTEVNLVLLTENTNIRG